MSKRKHLKKATAKAQRASQAVVRSPRPKHVRLVAAASNESPPKPRHEDSAPNESMTAAPAVERRTIATQDDGQRTISDDDFAKAFDVFPGAANLAAYRPTKLPDLAQANMQLAFEFAQRLAQMKSPLELPTMFSELMIKQFAMFQNAFFSNLSTR
jgi:hypothetical protein